MKITDMKLTPEMKKRMGKEMESPDAPEYPFGSRITIEDDHVDGMGMGNAKKGDEMEMSGTAKVIGTVNEDSAGGKRRSVELQITKMGMGKAKKSNPAKALYGEKGGGQAGGGMSGHKGM